MTVFLPMGTLPVGYRFRPTDEELINHYLRLKINGCDKEVSVIREVDVCKCEPWDLPDLSMVESVDNEWFFFCPKDRKYQNGQRSNRATVAGYWKATGKDRFIKSSKGMNVIGRKKTLVFYTGRAPKGQRTHWVIHEYSATDEDLNGTHPGQSAFVLCRLFKKQDEVSESSNCDEVEQNVLFPSVGQLSAEDSRSEPVTPILGQQGGAIGRYVDEIVAIPDTPRTTGKYSNGLTANDVEGKDQDIKYVKPDLALKNVWRDFYELPEPPDSKIFSPLHTQMINELGLSYLNSPNTFSEDDKAVQFQYGTNCTDIRDFLDSVLLSSDEDSVYHQASTVESETPNYTNNDRSYVKDTTSCSKPDLEVAHGQMITPSENCITPDFKDDQSGNLFLIEQTSDAPSAIAVGDQVRDLLNLEESCTGSNAVAGDNVIGTGIRIRPRLLRNQASAQNFAAQGNASKRLRLQTELRGTSNSSNTSEGLSHINENSGGKRLVLEAQAALKNGFTTASDSASGTDETEEVSLVQPYHDEEVASNLKLEGDSPIGGHIKVPSMFLEKVSTALCSALSYLRIPGTFMALGLVVVVVGIWGNLL